MKQRRREGELPPLEKGELERRLRRALPDLDLDAGTLRALHAHYVELRRWNRSASLVGSGTGSTVVERHYAESLAALPYLGAGPLVDLGSGAGFPGLVLALARPLLEVTLVESRRRKAAFLEWAAQRSGARCRVLCVRLALPLPVELFEEIESLTLRAVSLQTNVWEAVVDRLIPEGRILHWAGPRQVSLEAEVSGLELEVETPLPGSEGRKLRVLRRAR